MKCHNCMMKHLGQAFVLTEEYLTNDYDAHLVLAIGHLAEAEREGPEWRELIRGIRKRFEEGKIWSVDIYELIKEITDGLDPE